MACMSIRYCSFKIVMLQKIKNKDASYKSGHFSEIRTVIFTKT